MIKNVWYIVWVAGLMFAAALALSVSSPTKQVGKVLSRQEHLPPTAFPVREENTPEPIVRAKYAVLVDADSFYPLFKKDAYLPVPVASTTKMMTALVALERYQLTDEVTVSRSATLQIGSDTGFIAGERLTVESLLKSLLIQSGNDAAHALAEYSGSPETFVGWMNEKAASIGMRLTLFKDSAGLDDEGKSTAFDLAVLAAKLLEVKSVRDITGTAEATISSVDGRHSHLLKNSNRLVTPELYFPGAFGLKTGFTPGAGHTLVAAAERDGHTLVSVVLFTHEDTKEASAKESARLLSWGFDNHTWIK